MVKTLDKVTLGLGANWKQFTLLVIINGFVGGMVGLERSILPQIAQEEFGIAARTAILSFIVVFGITKAITNYYTGSLSNRFGRKKLLVLGWIIASLSVLVLQFIYGALMAGHKAATAAPTWPDINGHWLPTDIHQWGSREMKGLSFLTDHPLVIHFIHRGLAYIIAVLIFIWWWKARKVEGTAFFRNTRYQPLVLVLLQVLLGILTVLNANTHGRLLYMGVSHQFTAMMLLLGMFWVMYIVRKERAI